MKFKCNKCSFAAYKPVLPISNKESDVLILIDTPSEYNDYDYGAKVNKLFKKYNVSKHNLFLLNMCYKKDKGTGRIGVYTSGEINNCYGYLKKFLKKNKQIKYIFCLGMNAGNLFMKPEVEGTVVNKYVKKDNKFYYTTYNPADIKNREWLFQEFKDHFKRFFDHFYKNKGLVKPSIKINIIKTLDDLKLINKKIKELEKKKWPFFAYDIETHGLDMIKKEFRIISISFSFDDKEAFVIPLDHSEKKYLIQKNKLEIKEWFKIVFTNKKIRGIAHNAKFEYKSIYKYYDIETNNLGFDTQLVWHVLFDNKSKKLKDLTYYLTDYGGYENVIDKKKIKSFDDIDLDVLLKYNGYDTAVTYYVYEWEKKLISKRNCQILAYEIYPETIPAFSMMELTGMRLDIDKLKDYKIRYLQDLKHIEAKINSYKETKKACKLLKQKKLNINSTKQLKILLFKVMGVDQPTNKSGKKLPGTDKDSIVLYSRKYKHPIFKDLQEYSPKQKLFSTYLNNIEKEWIFEDGLVHTNLDLKGTANGRPSSANPNMLNLPGGWYKTLFLPHDEDFIFLHSDWSQLESRVITSYSKDPTALHMFKTGQDPHSTTTAKIFNITYKEANANKSKRKVGKQLNFGIPYGMGKFGLAQKLTLVTKKDVSLEEAQVYIDGYMKGFPKHKQIIDKCIKLVKTKGYIQNVFGRRRNLMQGKYGVSSKYREGVNALIQGTAGEMALYAFGKMHKVINKNNWQNDVKLNLTVYDSVLVSVRKNSDLILKVAKMVNNIMTAPPYDCMKVPIEADMEIGFNYGDLYDYDIVSNLVTYKDKKISLKNFLTFYK